MNRSAENILRDVVGRVTENVREPWIRLTVNVDAREEGLLSLTGNYVQPDAEDRISFPIHPRVAHLLREFRDEFRQDGAEMWTGASLEIDQQGRFELHLRYD